jgi:hypothetical protein
MIDGFGWFAEGDYRRAFLLFDRVDYLFPSKVHGPLWYPESVFQSPEYTGPRSSRRDDRGDVELWPLGRSDQRPKRTASLNWILTRSGYGVIASTVARGPNES